MEKEITTSWKGSFMEEEMVAVAYEPPQVQEVGDVVELVLGGGHDDTRDGGHFYY
ncbi:lasso RiPP family leader peptide-containing protein [Saccharopolyspora elongata]|uniref:Lasso RiPP family leader peptide-containing protein n=1 Tax=Saccharopolyspora elongata TaxID=2530387 RepID=A0A4R4YJU2_9PSEU|nr:lasso RiPP family leader peptide-containing protein [Saccharopolyspora elongata]TDD44289.1 lasso RiPP family leader peptide-containing protein [Saccharopolyspora elongata]